MRLLGVEELAQTPSRKDGIVAEKEAKYRRECIHFIKEIATEMELTPTTYFTAMAIFHRFFTLYSFKQLSRYNFAAASLIVGGKIEEQPKKLKVLLPIVHRQKCIARKLTPVKMTQQEYRDLQLKVLSCERMILQAIGFDLSYPNPLDALISFARNVTVDGFEICPNNVVQTAVDFLNDSYYLPLCVQFEPKKIALALLDLAAHNHKVKLVWKEAGSSSSNPWFVHALPKKELVCENRRETQEETKTDKEKKGDEDNKEDAASYTSPNGSYRFIVDIIVQMQSLLQSRQRKKPTEKSPLPSSSRVSTPTMEDGMSPHPAKSPKLSLSSSSTRVNSK
eukprot:m.17268 g.17268  ORF g.17268 m.17268 type:complete len:336 (+) comp4757_c0_seq1:126-1133(+)